MSSLPTITVTGTSSISHVAQRGVATIVVSSESTSQEDVAANVRSASASLKALLSSLTPKDPSGVASPDAPVTHWSNSSLSTSSHMVRINPDSSDDKRMERHHTARMGFQVKFQDFEKLGAIATQLSTMEHVNIQGIQWQLTDVTKDRLGTEGRGNAMRDAVRRAKDYFEAMQEAGVLRDGGGRTEVKVVEVVEGGGSRGGNSSMHYQSHHGGGYPAGYQGGGIEFTPENVKLNSEITVKFEVVPAEKQ